MKTIDEIFEEIEKAKKVLLVSHVNPDGDTLGSCCAMKEFIGEKADVFIQTTEEVGVPENLKFLKGINKAKFSDTVEDIYDLVIALDVASIDRITGEARKIFDKAPLTINIDHHKTNKGYGKINWIKGDVSSTGEILFNMFKEKNLPITKDIGDCLYVAILTDTGGFRYENTKKETLCAAGELISLGVDNAEIAKKCYNQKAKNMVLFQAAVVANSEFLFNDTVVIGLITKEIFEKFNAKNEYTEGIAETLRTIKTVEVSAVLKENDLGNTKVSLRSDNVDVAEIVQAFNGGGHSKAAGCTIKQPLNKAKELLIQEIKKCLKP